MRNRLGRRFSALLPAALCTVIAHGVAQAQIVSLSAEGDIYAKSFVAIGYDVKAVLPSRSDEPWFPTLYNPPFTTLVLQPTSLRPEALAMRNGLLYVAGDWNETQNQIAVFTTNPWGEIAYDHSIELPLSNPPPTTTPNSEWWGPEGMTFNTSGSGLGAGGSSLVTIDDQQAGIGGTTFATIDRTSGALSNFRSTVAVDDIAYGPVTNRFYMMISTPNSVQVLDTNMVPTGATWSIPARARGITVVSAAFGQFLTGDATLTGDIILVVCKEDTLAIPALKNRLVTYKSDGTQVGAVQDLSWVDLSLDNSSNGGTEPGPHEMEAIVIDETNKVIYIGDEAARAVYAIKAVTTGTSVTSGPVFGRMGQATGRYIELGMPPRNAEPWYAAMASHVSSPPKLRPEGMVFRNGTLHVSGDWNETQDQIAKYTASSLGVLTYAGSIQSPISNPPPNPATANNELWGPEGLTFNTSATGYGAGATALVTVEDAQYLMFGNTRALVNPTTGVLSDLGTWSSVVGAVSPDDISYGALTNRFYVLGDPDLMQVWTTAPAYDGTQFALPLRSKGVVVVSPSFAQFLLNDAGYSQEALLVVAKGQVGSGTAPNNRLFLLSTSGGILLQQDMFWTREAFPGQPLQEYEAVAVDEANKFIYIGDEKAGGVFAMRVFVALVITNGSPLPSATFVAAYSQTLVASGGVSPYSFTLASGSLPPGVSLAAGGLISGTPTQCGAFTFSARVTDSFGVPITKLFTLSVIPTGLLGDMNSSGTRNGLDVQGFIKVVVSGGTGLEICRADMDADGVVTLLDVPLFVTTLLGS